MQKAAKGHRYGFTLVELLIAIAIIGLLMAIAVPTAYTAYKRAKIGAMKMEVTNLTMAIEKYKQTYGDYPPDGSDGGLMRRHVNKAFPRIIAEEFDIFNAAVRSVPGLQVLDPAESLVFFLGGFSSDPQRPFSGTGGPLKVISRPTVGNPNWVIEYNLDRSNALFEFDPTRLTIVQETAGGLVRTLSNDEEINGGQAGLRDCMPVYRPKGLLTPFVYFDSRTYGPSSGVGYTKYFGANVRGVARPYKSEKIRGNSATPPTDPILYDRYYRYQNETTFQVVTAGLDDSFGGVAGASAGAEVLFAFPSGIGLHPDGGIAGTFSRYASAQNPAARDQLDNITNFSESTLEDGLPN